MTEILNDNDVSQELEDVDTNLVSQEPETAEPESAEEEKKQNPFARALRTFCGWFGFGVLGGSSSKKTQKDIL